MISLDSTTSPTIGGRIPVQLPSGGDSSDNPITISPINRLDPTDRIIDDVIHTPTPLAPTDITNTFDVTVNQPSLTPAVSADIPPVTSGLGDILSLFASLFSGSSGPAVAAPPTPQATTAVPVNTQQATDTASNTTGKGVVIVAGIVLGGVAVVYFGYKRGWFKKLFDAKKDGAA